MLIVISNTKALEENWRKTWLFSISVGISSFIHLLFFLSLVQAIKSVKKKKKARKRGSKKKARFPICRKRPWKDPA